jgi:small conductance mechanosensitive channel
MLEKIISLLMESKALLISYSMSLLGAIILLVAGWIVAGWAQRVTRRLMDRSVVFDDTLKPLVASIVRYVVLIFVLVAVLAQFGVQTASIIAVLGAAGLAIGLALQGTLANIAAGAMLLILRPLRVGEFIEAGSISGSVKEVGLFTTLMVTADGLYISVPNSQLWNTTIKNFTRLPTRRIDLMVGIGYRDDIDKAMGALQTLIAAEPRILKKPAGEVMVMQLADSAVMLNVRVWTKRDDYWNVFFDLNKKVKNSFDAEGISIPFPHRELRLGETLNVKIV